MRLAVPVGGGKPDGEIPVKHCQPILIGICLTALGIVGCSGLGSPTSPSTTGTSTSSTPSLPVSQSSIETAISNFARGATNSANTSNVGGTSLRGLGGLDQGLLPLTTVQVNQPFSQRTNCNVGGYHETSGQISGSIDTEPNSTSRLQLNATQTIHDYACLATGWLVNGDPYISANGEIRITGSNVSLDFRQSLGWKANNPETGGSFSCQHDVSITWDSLNGGRVQGWATCTPPLTKFAISLTF